MKRIVARGMFFLFFLGGGRLNLIYNDGNVYDRFNDLILTEYR